MSTLEEQIDAATADIERYELKLQNAKETLHNLRNKLWNLEPGKTLVRAIGEQPMLLREVSHSDYSRRPWVKAAPFKKDGKPSENLKNLYGDWEIVVQ